MDDWTTCLTTTTLEDIKTSRHQDIKTSRHQDINPSTHQSTNALQAMKHCSICASDDVPLRVSPKNHKHDENERACGQCWEGYLSLQVEEKNNLSDIQCMFCTSEISEHEFISLAQKGTEYR